MTQERFFQIVDDPDLLRRITYEELKTLALAYPYAHNLRCLLAAKAQQVDHPEATRNLSTAAAYSLDRSRLFLLLAPQVIVPQQVIASSEMLELKPIKTVQQEIEALAPLARATKPAEPPMAAESPVPRVDPALVEEKKMEAEQIASGAVVVVPESPTPVQRQTFGEWIGLFQSPTLETRPSKDMVEKIIADTPTTDDEEAVREEKPEPKTTGVAQQLAERSVAENQDVISETLAKLYAKQGYREKAVQMYARLALLFPEKSAFFAAEIDKLKK